jgi:hypothetical protein
LLTFTSKVHRGKLAEMEPIKITAPDYLIAGIAATPAVLFHIHAVQTPLADTLGIPGKDVARLGLLLAFAIGVGLAVLKSRLAKRDRPASDSHSRVRLALQVFGLFFASALLGSLLYGQEIAAFLGIPFRYLKAGSLIIGMLVVFPYLELVRRYGPSHSSDEQQSS